MKMKHRHGWSDTLPVIYGARQSAIEHLDKVLHRMGFSLTAEIHQAAPAIGVWRRNWRRIGRLLGSTFRRFVPPPEKPR